MTWNLVGFLPASS